MAHHLLRAPYAASNRSGDAAYEEDGFVRNAQLTRLLVGDELIAINAIRLDSTERLRTIVNSSPPSTRYTLLINRTGRVQRVEITSATPEAIPFTLERADPTPESTAALRDTWLRDGPAATSRP